jgi:acyl-CoA synthetase (AMP-forming)/AMP-acid ligase II
VTATDPAVLPPLLAGLRAATADHPDRAAILDADGAGVDFATLHDRVGRAVGVLRRHGVTDGARAVLLVPPGPGFVVAAFALLAAGAVPVLVDPGIGVRRVRRALADVAPRAFVGSARAHAARRALRLAPTADRLLTVDDAWPGRGASADHAGWAPRDDDAEAALLFTSGSTGPPKAVVYRHRHFAAQLAALRDAYDLAPGEVTVATFPPFALFGPALGQTTVLPTMDFTRPAATDPAHLVDVVARHRADLLFASPALLGVLARHGAATGARMPTLRLVLSAGAPVPASVVADTALLLRPGARLATPYGMTEALPVATIDGGALAAAATYHDPPRGVCVGTPVTGTDVAIVAVTAAPLPAVPSDAPLPDGQVGELVVAGAQVTDAYAERPRATERAKTVLRGAPAHRTGDLAWRDDAGRLWFCGRTVHRVPTPQGALDPLPVEQIALADPRVWRAALVGVPAGAPVRSPVVVVQPVPGALPRWRPGARRRRAALLADLRRRLDAHPHSARVTGVLLRRRFPVDARHNAKIGYEQLARWATARQRGWTAWVGRRAFGGGTAA